MPPTAWAVLGLLSFGRELSGYELKKWADHSLAFFYWSPAISQIYGELKRLEGLGYAVSREVAQDDLRNKRVYAITPSGLDALTGWVRESPVEPPVLKHAVLLRVWLGQLVDPAQLRSVIEQHRAYAESMLEGLRSDEMATEREPAWAYAGLVLKWGERYYESERDRADAMLRDLDAM